MVHRLIGKRVSQAGVLLLALFLCCCEQKPKPVPQPEPEKEDPVLHVQIPGAYGIPGGNQVYSEDRHQLSTIECPDGTLLFHLLDPGERKVMSIHGIPATVKEGDRISLHFRIMTNGYTLQSETFENTQVLKVTPKLIWLKKDENTFFVLER